MNNRYGETIPKIRAGKSTRLQGIEKISLDGTVLSWGLASTLNHLMRLVRRVTLLEWMFTVTRL